MKVQKPLYKAPKSPTHEGVTTTLQSTKVTNLWRCNSPFTKPKSQPNLKVWQLLYKAQKSSIHEGATIPSLIILIAKVGKSGASSRGNMKVQKLLYKPPKSPIILGHKTFVIFFCFWPTASPPHPASHIETQWRQTWMCTTFSIVVTWTRTTLQAVNGLWKP